MDRVMKSFLDKFRKEEGLEKDEETEVFDHFVNYTIIDP